MGILRRRPSATALCSRLMSTTNRAAGVFVHGADAVQVLEEAGGFAAVHGLFLFAVIVDRAIGFPFLNGLEAGDGAFDGVEIGQGAAQPAFGDVELPAGLGGLFDGFLGLLLGADKQDAAAFGDQGVQVVAGRFQLRQRFAQVNDVDAVARVEDERLHPGVPTPGLMPEMDAGVQ